MGQRHRAVSSGPPPNDPARDGPWRFASRILMDDNVLVEPELGGRPQASAATYDPERPFTKPPENGYNLSPSACFSGDSADPMFARFD